MKKNLHARAEQLAESLQLGEPVAEYQQASTTRAWWSDPWRVLFYGEGLVDVRKRQVRGTRWDDVEFVQKLRTNRVSRYTVRTRDGTEFSFDHRYLNAATAQPAQDVGTQSSQSDPLQALLQSTQMQVIIQTNQMYGIIEREVDTRLWEKVRGEYEAGGPVIFGPLQVSHQGVSNGQEQFPWNKVAALRLLGEDLDQEPEEESKLAIIREFKPSANQRESHGETDSIPEKHLSYWNKDVTHETLLQITAKDEDAPLCSLWISQIPNALLLVTLVDYQLHFGDRDDQG